MTPKLKDVFQNEADALRRLKETLDRSATDDVVRDATIQRFEFCIELMWKLLGRILYVEGLPTQFPKETLQKAFGAKLIDNEKLWLSMLEDRNKTSHTYKQELAHEIYNRIKTYYPVLQATYDKLAKRYSKE